MYGCIHSQGRSSHPNVANPGNAPTAIQVSSGIIPGSPKCQWLLMKTLINFKDFWFKLKTRRNDHASRNKQDILLPNLQILPSKNPSFSVEIWILKEREHLIYPFKFCRPLVLLLTVEVKLYRRGLNRYQQHNVCTLRRYGMVETLKWFTTSQFSKPYLHKDVLYSS